MVVINFTILGKKWKLRVLSKKKYLSKNGEDSIAITMMYKRQMDIHPSGIDNETLIHELVHAYLSEMCLSSTNKMTLADLEEVFAELMSKRGQELLDLASKLLSTILNLTSPTITSATVIAVEQKELPPNKVVKNRANCAKE